ncbi:MAG TPA: hypothetical protein PKD49_03010 [Hyphomicrobium sp.]|nr:hypothetical protein [Hyphomicrobium sp.]
MTYQPLFARELKQWMMPVESGEGRSATADAISADVLGALRAILVEIEEASVYVAITASIASALHRGRAPALTVKHLKGYLPSNPQVYRRHIDTVLAAALSPYVILPLQAYHARLGYALRLTNAIADAGPAPSATIRTAEFDNLQDAWRHVCGTALAAISVVRELMASVRYSRPPVNNEHAEALLRSAKDGGQPCVTDEGTMRMPMWAESRLHARQVTQLRARLLLLDGEKSAIVDNASRTGIGLSGVTGLVPGTALTILLDTGEEILGKIMWSRGERAGVRLDAMLAADHPLLGGVAASAKQ